MWGLLSVTLGAADAAGQLAYLRGDLRGELPREEVAAREGREGRAGDGVAELRCPSHPLERVALAPHDVRRDADLGEPRGNLLGYPVVKSAGVAHEGLGSRRVRRPRGQARGERLATDSFGH